MDSENIVTKCLYVTTNIVGNIDSSIGDKDSESNPVYVKLW